MSIDTGTNFAELEAAGPSPFDAPSRRTTEHFSEGQAVWEWAMVDASFAINGGSGRYELLRGVIDQDGVAKYDNPGPNGSDGIVNIVRNEYPYRSIVDVNHGGLIPDETMRQLVNDKEYRAAYLGDPAYDDNLRDAMAAAIESLEFTADGSVNESKDRGHVRSPLTHGGEPDVRAIKSSIRRTGGSIEYVADPPAEH